MKSDSEILLMYQEFVSSVMPSLNMLEDREKELLNQVSFFNKKSKYNEIKQMYSKFNGMVYSVWKTIYDNENEFINTLAKESILKDGQSVYAKTEAARLIEQFFYSLIMRTHFLIMFFDGKMNKENSNKACDVPTNYMLKMMNGINTKYLNSMLPLYPIDE